MDNQFRICGSCKHSWQAWRDFVLDPGLRLLGLQISPALPESNLLIFEHRCGSTISVFTRVLRPLLEIGDRQPRNLFGTEECNQHCRLVEDLSACDRPCVNACDRALVKKILDLRGVRR